MDSQNQQPGVSPGQLTPPSSSTQGITPQQPVTPGPATTLSTAKPEIQMSDADVRSLFALNGLQDSSKRKLHLPIGVVLTSVVLVILLMAVNYMLGKAKTSAPAKSPTSTSTLNESPTQQGEDRVNQDVNSCSNIVSAVTQC